MPDPQIQFDSNRYTTEYSSRAQSKQRSVMISFAMKLGAATEEQARSVLVGFIIVAFIATIYLFFWSGKHTPSAKDIPVSEKDDFFHVYQR